ncbi:TPA: hypothetical protein DCZ46_03360 [Candidatus Campbellbacteria bacterium]|uniref:Uncharacterized protein n=2 Tax=Candidatus Campbelliibacteriota TaxID=1752727 RepID=A0A1F5EMY3_9BACT|nr:MAG: hypothetical protein UR58_C0001G0642 [Candidatus Campbellbacteria bacterium GW2011_OD1_34_28]KKP74832.1 MAG: hypothetical protein UR74_C0002G0098 [Candidatus Campbellbacteria bacterium GW2011_GWD2_35_24]KKP75718.1 MAG: hypothetical protein UR75_C0002G0099 [Candidatus Campbellbacteria bacterium GW2011_GWC2_35_28]KKP77034.1 MAG: hypothetical protein UR76_C0002G0235 [Candidatus Campbellbacteria bacterium GW2011_GWC1_35_31]KKP78960.1 MAG: hypothetical protein UR79_C0002G0235 [Candidatus Cam
MYIKVKAYPKSKREEVVQTSENRFEIKVKEKAEMNMANKKIIELVARHFGVVEGKVKIINGHQSPSKLLSINID